MGTNVVVIITLLYVLDVLYVLGLLYVFAMLTETCRTVKLYTTACAKCVGGSRLSMKVVVAWFWGKRMCGHAIGRWKGRGWEMRDVTLGVEVGGAVCGVGEDVTVLDGVGLAGLV